MKNVKTTPCTVALPKLRALTFDLTQHRVTAIPFDAEQDQFWDRSCRNSVGDDPGGDPHEYDKSTTIARCGH
ncbi:hypothetical protein ACVWYH_006729 [Bradyrhizobium sp. GM24.11]